MHVPTLAELAHLNLATARAVKGVGTVYEVSEGGHRLMGEAMRANALEARARGEANWSPPHSTLAVPLSALLDPESPQ